MLEALLAYERAGGASQETTEARLRGQEYLLMALSNRAWPEAMAPVLKPGGILLSNDRLTWMAAGSLSAGVNGQPFDVPGVNARQVICWCRKR